MNNKHETNKGVVWKRSVWKLCVACVLSFISYTNQQKKQLWTVKLF